MVPATILDHIELIHFRATRGLPPGYLPPPLRKAFKAIIDALAALDVQALVFRTEGSGWASIDVYFLIQWRARQPIREYGKSLLDALRQSELETPHKLDLMNRKLFENKTPSTAQVHKLLAEPLQVRFMRAMGPKPKDGMSEPRLLYFVEDPCLGNVKSIHPWIKEPYRIGGVITERTTLLSGVRDWKECRNEGEIFIVEFFLAGDSFSDLVRDWGRTCAWTVEETRVFLIEEFYDEDVYAN